MATASSVVEAEQQPDQIAGADHLRDQIERHHRQRPDRRGHAHRRLPQPKRDDVGEGVFAEIAQRLGDQKHHHRPADQESDRVDQAVEPGERDQAGNAKKARRAHVVAGQRESVLQTGNAAAGGIEMVGTACASGGNVGERQRDGDDNQEAGNRDEVRFPDRAIHAASA